MGMRRLTGKSFSFHPISLTPKLCNHSQTIGIVLYSSCENRRYSDSVPSKGTINEKERRMSYGEESFQPEEYTMADRATAEDRGAFIVKTYLHLFAAILAFIGIETVIQMTGLPVAMLNMIGASSFGWLLVLGAFMGVSYVANSWAHGGASLGTQYAGLGLYVVAEAFIFAPILYFAAAGFDGVIASAAMATLFIFAGLTAVVMVTRKNFSFMGPFLGVLGMAAMGLIVCSLLFGFNLGIFFTYAMIAFAAGYILYSTSNVLHEYHTGQYVAASLSLFASVALLFWYVLQLFMSRR
jgi:FtsH-binding integral membrane protein